MPSVSNGESEKAAFAGAVGGGLETTETPENRALPNLHWRQRVRSHFLYWLCPAGAQNRSFPTRTSPLWSGPKGTKPTAAEWERIAASASRLNAQLAAWRAGSHQPQEVKRVASRAEPGFVYFIRSGGRVKIGHALNPHERLHTLQTGSADALEPVALVEGSPDVERFIHYLFRADHIHHEWFHETAALVAFIRDHAKPFPNMRKRRERAPRWKPAASASTVACALPASAGRVA